ncbi:hypothetical protein MTBSS4_10030 [Magnetospirillum sp. SS-4]|nr:hypothetical protein MTBSS4_10030 [Magnetospirillum sp. SS-4]
MSAEFGHWPRPRPRLHEERHEPRRTGDARSNSRLPIAGVADSAGELPVHTLVLGLCHGGDPDSRPAGRVDAGGAADLPLPSVERGRVRPRPRAIALLSLLLTECGGKAAPSRMPDRMS